MLNYCLFCYKNCDKDGGSLGQGGDTGKKSEILKRLLNNLERLLNCDNGFDLKNERSSKNGGLDDLSSSSHPKESGLNACEDCLKTVKSFCDLYNELEKIKLLLNWKLETIIHTMTTSTSHLSSMGDLVILKESNEKLISFRKDLINKMSSTRFNSYPKIILERTQIARIRRDALLPTTENLSKETPNAKDNPPEADENSIGEEWEFEDDVGSEAHCMEVDKDFVLSDSDLSSDENSSSSDIMDTEGPINSKKKVDHPVKPEILFVKLEKKIGPEKCNLCTKSYSTNLGLRNHKRKVHPDQYEAEPTNLQSSYRFKCPDCEVIFEKIHSLKLHWRDSHLKDEANNKPSDRLSIEVITISLDSKGHYCENSAKNFARIEVPQLKLETEVKICSTCQRIFYSQEEFEAHEKLHGSFTCAFCSTEKAFLPELSIHEARAHTGTIKNNPNAWKCLRCEMKFADATSYLRHHSKIHFSLSFSEQSCVICKAFLLKYEQRKDIHKLFRHIENCHNLNRPSKSGEVFKCEEVNCCAYFTTLRGLTSHRKIVHLLDQDKLKDFKLERNLSVCEECGKSFPSSGRLKTHMISHTSRESWEFCCEICSRKCQTKSKLEIHLKTHTGEQPFVCEVCGAKYTAKHKLKAHFEKKHGKL